MDEKLIERFQEEGTGDILGDIRSLSMTSMQRVLDLLDRIEYEYKIDAGPSYGTLTEREVKYRYDLLLSSLPNIPGLSEQERTELEAKIQEKVRDIPRVELASINNFLKNEDAVHEAVSRIAEEKGISYEDAKKEFLTNAKERVEHYNKMIEEQNNAGDKPKDGEEPHDGDGNR